MRKYNFEESENKTAKTVLKKLLSTHPLLNPSGWAPEAYYHDCIFEKGFTEHRNSLADRTEEFLRVCSWLDGIPKSDKKKDRVSSYFLKHIAEKQVDMYIPNGVMIAAALHLCFQMEMPGKGDQNPCFYLDKKIVNEKRREAGF